MAAARKETKKIIKLRLGAGLCYAVIWRLSDITRVWSSSIA